MIPAARSLFTVAALLCATAANAQDETATAFVIHGIPGQDLGMDIALPVDVFISGIGCAIEELKFGDRVEALLPAGTYDITVSLADDPLPCSGTEVIALTDVALDAGSNSTLIAHRTALGTVVPEDLLGLGITATQFDNDFTPTDRGRGRILAHHTARAPTVDVVVRRRYAIENSPGSILPDFSNPTAFGKPNAQINGQFRPGTWQLALELEGELVFGPDPIELKPFTATYVYAVGTFPDTFQYLIYVESGLR